MSSKFFGNRTDKHQPKKKGVKQNFINKNNKSKSSGVRKESGEKAQKGGKHECIINIT